MKIHKNIQFFEQIKLWINLCIWIFLSHFWRQNILEFVTGIGLPLFFWTTRKKKQRREEEATAPRYHFLSFKQPNCSNIIINMIFRAKKKITTNNNYRTQKQCKLEWKILLSQDMSVTEHRRALLRLLFLILSNFLVKKTS